MTSSRIGRFIQILKSVNSNLLRDISLDIPHNKIHIMAQSLEKLNDVVQSCHRGDHPSLLIDLSLTPTSIRHGLSIIEQRTHVGKKSNRRTSEARRLTNLSIRDAAKF